MSKKAAQKLKQIVAILSKEKPEPSTELVYQNEYELTVAVVLSAQCTDARVNQITPSFFARFPDFFSLSKASYDEVYSLIKSCSYPNNKTKHLLGLAKEITFRFNGKLPRKKEELLSLPGIGRKTAHVLLSVLEKQNVLAVDTHVFRVAKRLGLAPRAKTPRDVELKLTQLAGDIPLYYLHHWLILHGRYVCKARKPLCSSCSLTQLCDFYVASVKSKLSRHSHIKE